MPEKTIATVPESVKTEQLQQNVHNVVELRVKWSEHQTCSKWW